MRHHNTRREQPPSPPTLNIDAAFWQTDLDCVVWNKKRMNTGPSTKSIPTGACARKTHEHGRGRALGSLTRTCCARDFMADDRGQSHFPRVGKSYMLSCRHTKISQDVCIWHAHEVTGTHSASWIPIRICGSWFVHTGHRTTMFCPLCHGQLSFRPLSHTYRQIWIVSIVPEGVDHLLDA